MECLPERPAITNEEVYAPAEAIEPRLRLMVLPATFCGLRLRERMAVFDSASTRELLSLMAHASHRAAVIHQHAVEARDHEIAAELSAMANRLRP